MAFKPAKRGRRSEHAQQKNRNYKQGGGQAGKNQRKRIMRNGIDISKFINKAEPIKEAAPYIPTHTFADFNLHELLQKNIVAKNYVNPSPIQDNAIPAALEGRDVVGIANTGTGKTAAFLIPIINKILENPSETALIITPTRELAIQIDKEFASFTKGISLFSAVCVGGAPMFQQIKNIRKGCHVVIGTPGRLIDLAERGELSFSDVSNVVLDEADKMLDMGFIDDIARMLEVMPEDKQSLFFSATFPKKIENLVQSFMHDPEIITVKTRDTSKNIDQDVVYTTDFPTKIDGLHTILSEGEAKKVIIFAGMKTTVHDLALELERRGHRAGSIHGDKRHRERQQILEAFKKNDISILVATDVAARGLDIPEVTHVINYEIPNSYDTYVHRIGRTGRADKKGCAITFV